MSLFLLVGVATLVAVSGPTSPTEGVGSPVELVFSPDSSRLFVSDRTGGRLYILETAPGGAVRSIKLRGKPEGIAVDPKGATVYVAECGAGSVAEISTASGTVTRRFTVGRMPSGIALAPGRGLLVVTNTVEGDISIVRLRDGTSRRVAAGREPHFVAVTPDEAYCLAGNLLPGGAANDTTHATLTAIHLEDARAAATIDLPSGSTWVRTIQVSPDGAFAYVVHELARNAVLSSDVQWLVDNALSIVDTKTWRIKTTMLLDGYGQGAADLWGLALSVDGAQAWITASGGQEVLKVEVARLTRLLSGSSPEELNQLAHSSQDVDDYWSRLKANPRIIEELSIDRAALDRGGILQRIPAKVRGPRGIAARLDGAGFAVAGYFSGDVAFLSARGEVTEVRALSPRVSPGPERKGEELFHDATISLQRRVSCATCHPNDGRVDGLRWDLPNDGAGSPQDTRSLLWSHRVELTTARGVRSGVKESVPAGFGFLGTQATPERVHAILAYLESLKPETSPWRALDGSLSSRAQRGKEIFEGKSGCSRCHSGPLLSDEKRHAVGTGEQAASDRDRPPLKGDSEGFITPRLVELYRTAPFLHDGRAATLEDILTVHNPHGHHGDTGGLNAGELEDLIEYLRSL